ncbi:DUF1217 domain-containing protein [Thioclava sp. DLFJ4-1]|uniref:DUF1217 domain-containing protein n=1 Tax=Thioclava sp. DLFJ4-1 TaxID=1915313 RepID=UPI0009979A3B|nr:DUF1217 domain-containing protein [Thioclava sp. DLFJ4-1]OOY15244.1 hypothetical protein BMI85_17045 [Thioclava sp. DLFJ4-1]
MLTISGMSSRLALNLIDRTQAKQLDQLAAEPQHARAISRFRENIADIHTAADLVDNYDAYSFVMKAFDLEDQMFGKAMMREILSSDSADKTSLVNKLTDPRFRKLYDALGFTNGGTANTNTSSTAWQDKIVDQYVSQQFINGESEQNATVGSVLEFRQKLDGVKTWYSVLKDKDTAQFMRTALGIPNDVVKLDVERQKQIFEDKFDLTKLKDPKEVDNLISHFVAVSDAQSFATNGAGSAAVTLMQGAVQGGSGQFVPATFDLTAIATFSASRYR